jgi:hypothetical protein
MTLTQAQCALNTLQSTAARTFETYLSEVLGRAMDEIVRNFDNDRPAKRQVRSARANAAKVLGDRRRLAPTIYITSSITEPDGVDHDLEIPVDENGFGEFDVLHWLATTTQLPDGVRALLQDLASGHDANSLAMRDNLPVARMRERISRARRQGRIAYAAACGEG